MLHLQQELLCEGKRVQLTKAEGKVAHAMYVLAGPTRLWFHVARWTA